MRYIVWLLRIALFLLLFTFTLKNTSLVTVHGLLERQWEAPLVVFLLGFFVAGVILGCLSMLPSYIRARRELADLKKQLKKPPVVNGVPLSTPAEPAQPLDAVL